MNLVVILLAAAVVAVLVYFSVKKSEKPAQPVESKPDFKVDVDFPEGPKKGTEVAAQKVEVEVLKEVVVEKEAVKKPKPKAKTSAKPATKKTEVKKSK